MGNTVAFDTHKFVKQLMAAGFNEEQAETQMGLLSEILSAQLSTKSDVAKVDAHVLELKRDIAAIDANLKRDIAAIDATVENTKAELKRDIAAIDAKIENTKVELKRDIAAIDAKVENTKVELKRDIAAIDAKVENTKVELKRDIKELDVKIETIKSDLKKDIENTKSELQKDIEITKSELQKDIANAKVTTIQWTAGMFAAQTALIIGAMFAVMKMNQPIVPAYLQPAQEMRQIAPVPPPVAAQPTAPPPAK